MPHDPALIAETRAWFHRVRTDLRSAEADLVAMPPILEDVVFHCQQAVEKTMKGFLTWHQRPFGKTHDLRHLGKLCVLIDATLQPIIERAAPLTRYAWQFRYPGDPSEPDAEEATRAMSESRETVEVFLERLPRFATSAETSVAVSLEDLQSLVARCEDDTRRILGHLAAERLGNWRRHMQTEQDLVEYIERLLWGEHCQNGKRLEDRGGLSLERIVLSHRPDLFSDSDKDQARRTLEIS